MKKFFIKMLIFLCPVVVVALCWEHGLNRITNRFTKKRSELEAKSSTLKVLVLGTSEALRGENPGYFSMEGYNMANDAQALYYDKALTMKYLDRLPELKFVFINITYFSLWYKMNEDDCRAYYIFWDIKYPGFNPLNINMYSKILYFTNQRAWDFALCNFNVDSAASQENGWIPYNASMPKTDSLGLKRVNYMDNVLSDKRQFSLNCRYLHELVDALTKRHVKAVFIIPPLPSIFMKFANKKKFAVTDSVLKSIATQYQCRYINYTMDKRFDGDDFRDADHLNQEGSTKFSKILNNEILTDSAGRQALISYRH